MSKRLSLKKFQTLIIVIFLGLLSSSAFAKVTIVSITGGSVVDASSSSYIVYGGTAGTCANGTNTCDSCSGGLTACNRARITASTVLTIQFSSDAQTGYAMVGDNTTGALVKDSIPLIAKGATGTVTLTWQEVCAKFATPDADCEGVDTAVALRVGIDSTNDDKLDSTTDDYATISFKVQATMAATVDPDHAGSSVTASNGIYTWSIYPGDAKVYLENVGVDEGFPSSANGILYSKFHLLYRKGTCADESLLTNKVDNAAGNYEVTTGIKSDGTLDDDRFLGFENEVQYVFKIAIEDQAGNIGLFYPNSASLCASAPHSETPSEVFGLLKNQKNCFIATAAFGSPFEKHVQTLRQFRDHVLLKFNLGKKLVSMYYDLSPPLAQIISESEPLKAATRIALTPVWTFALLSSVIGFWPSLIITICFILSFGIVLSWSRNRKTGASN